MLIFGLLIFVYGFSFSELALYFYGGNDLIGGNVGSISVALMRWQCLYIVLIALNGILEAFTFVSMNNRMVQIFSMSMVKLSFSFPLISVYTVGIFGCQEFILENCFNMFMRILYSIYLVQHITGKWYKDIISNIILFYAKKLQHQYFQWILTLKITFCFIRIKI